MKNLKKGFLFGIGFYISTELAKYLHSGAEKIIARYKEEF